MRREPTPEDQCRAEIATIEAYLRSGQAEQMYGALLGLADWSAELRLLEGEP